MGGGGVFYFKLTITLQEDFLSPLPQCIFRLYALLPMSVPQSQLKISRETRALYCFSLVLQIGGGGGY